MHVPILRLLFRITILSFPLLVSIIFYLLLDPFAVLHFKMKDAEQWVFKCRDFNTIEAFKKNYPIYSYDSFILGNSRSLAFCAFDWQKYISPSVPFHFDATNESLFGIFKKFIYLKKHKIKIKNAFITLDYPTLIQVKNNLKDITQIKHPEISGESYLKFHFLFYKSFFQDRYWLKYIDFKFNHIFRESYGEDTFQKRYFNLNLTTNDLVIESDENAIRTDSVGYYIKKIHRFYSRDTLPESYPESIGSIQVSYLQEIKSILQANKSEYYIIIHPHYNQIKLNSRDLNILNEIFGKNHVYDFSGKNEYTREVGNYFEPEHFKRKIGRDIFSRIYRKSIN